MSGPTFNEKDVRRLLNEGLSIKAIAIAVGIRVLDVRRAIARARLVRGQLDLFVDWLETRNKEPAQAWMARKQMMDQQIHELLNGGMNGRRIAAHLEIHPYQVREAKKRLGLIKKQEHHEVEFKDERPKRMYKCPVCRKEHWSAPHIWTCAECKAKQSSAGYYDGV